MYGCMDGWMQQMRKPVSLLEKLIHFIINIFVYMTNPEQKGMISLLYGIE
jgi:hypothetical protein